MSPLTWPRWLQTIVAVIALGLAAYGALQLWLALVHDPAVIDAHEAKVAAEVQAISTEAAAAASGAVAQSLTETERDNAHAREAAARSDDPLRDGLNSLRGKAKDRAAAR